MKNSVKFGAIAAVAALTLAGCGAAPEKADSEASKSPEAVATESAEAGGTAVDPADFKACMVSDEGGFDDQSFNQTAHAGLKRAGEELGIKTNEVESASEADFNTNVESLIHDDCDYIIGVGFKLAETLSAAAASHPDVKFALVDSTFAEGTTNGKALVFNTAEAAFLAGYAAAGSTKTGTVATFGGMPIPSVQIFMDGFVQGVDRYNTDHGTAVKVLGWDYAAQTGSFVGNFSDAPAGKTLTEGFIAQGADIIMPVAGPVGAGTITAAKEAAAKGVKVIWVDTDGYVSVPDAGPVVFTSVVKAMDVAVFDGIKEAVEGKFTADPYVGTLANQGVDLAPFHDFDAQVSADLKAELESLRTDIASGNLVVETKNAPN